jgi:hypothetical protein
MRETEQSKADREFFAARAALARARATSFPLRYMHDDIARRQLVTARDEEKAAEERVRRARIRVYLAGGWPPAIP